MWSPPHPQSLLEFVSAQGRSFGDRTAVVDGSTGLSRTYRNHLATTWQFVRALDRRDLLSLPTTSTTCPSRCDFRPRGKNAPINPLYTRSELQVVLQKSG
jgi:hypothetical protein